MDMFALPQIVSIPILSSVGGVPMDWPWIGAFLAWMVFAALVGTTLGFIREHTQRIPVARHPQDVNTLSVRRNDRHFELDTHREAA
jgi:hypothetical protein